MEDDQRRLQREAKKQKGKTYLLTKEALLKHDLLTGATELRQFACPTYTCSHSWWTHVPRTKPISTCRYCQVCYNALDRDKEFGIGRFTCACYHTFYARCEATEMKECFKCKKQTGPPYINPRFKPRRGYSSVKSDSFSPPLNASTPYESTGSTIAPSFITENLGSDIFVCVEIKISGAVGGLELEQAEIRSGIGDLKSSKNLKGVIEGSESQRGRAASDLESGLEVEEMSIQGSKHADSGIGTWSTSSASEYYCMCISGNSNQGFI